jgi:hypothetical protein
MSEGTGGMVDTGALENGIARAATTSVGRSSCVARSHMAVESTALVNPDVAARSGQLVHAHTMVTAGRTRDAHMEARAPFSHR